MNQMEQVGYTENGWHPVRYEVLHGCKEGQIDVQRSVLRSQILQLSVFPVSITVLPMVIMLDL